MGFPTPFPEPESPELQRFAVRSPSEIVSWLRAMQKAEVLLNAFVDAGASFGVVTLRRVDENAGEVTFHVPADAGPHDRLLSAPVATFVGYDDAGKVQFVAAPRAGPEGRSDEFTTPIPRHLFRLQRRSSARVRLENAKAAVCRIPLPGDKGEWEALRVLDISTGGIAVLAYPERFQPIVGQEFGNCRLDLPGIGGAVVDVRVRHLGPAVGAQQPHCCGCAFVGLTPPLSSKIERFLESLGSAAVRGN